MQAVLYFCVTIYVLFYVFESVVRYGFHLLGADALIFVRDALLDLAIVGLFLEQAWKRRLSPAFIVFILVVAIAGAVMLANYHSYAAVAYGVKMLAGLLGGALAYRLFFPPSKPMVMAVFLLWSATFTGVLLDKYFVEFPWNGMVTTIGELTVDISRDWEISGEDKRAGGFTRSSIHAAAVSPLLALILFFNLRSFLLRWGVCLATVPLVYWTTQKGSLLAFILTLGMLALTRTRSLILRLSFVFASAMAVVLPIILPNYVMPKAEGVFSFSSFYLRVEEMWPQAWAWIARSEVFPFGVGMGGIGGAQRFYAPLDINYADSLFVFMYAYFGYFAYIYLGWLVYTVLRQRDKPGQGVMQALAILNFLMYYGIVLSMLEDQMTAMFFGMCATMVQVGAQARAKDSQREETQALPYASLPHYDAPPAGETR